MSYQNEECVMHFLTGLNESYAQVHAQVLMMGNIILNNVSSSTAAATSLGSSQSAKVGNGDKVVCSHCHFRNHTVDKSYKFHGYPPRAPQVQTAAASERCTSLTDIQCHRDSSEHTKR
ncbi:hypothetical protein F511_10422 [Dorcoceras hygrometricum]|uniref:Uncharacterized protein n=1 Tax=Dorcoceras hygrometricum TaxID=472368 RepID=A0A2Z7C756_9LAMI|nr:hypothetical protein F511_10422 [Dorcoceras hygrometricum]